MNEANSNSSSRQIPPLAHRMNVLRRAIQDVEKSMAICNWECLGGQVVQDAEGDAELVSCLAAEKRFMCPQCRATAGLRAIHEDLVQSLEVLKLLNKSAKVIPIDRGRRP
jgi:hypothetical protein